MLVLAGLRLEMVGLLIVGFAIEALLIVGLLIVGLVIVGLTTLTLWNGAFEIVGFEIVGLVIVGFEIVGLVIVGFEIVGLVTSKFEIVGFEIVGFEIVGFVIVGFVGSGFSVVELDKPFGTSVPWGAVISAIFTVTLAVGFEEVTTTGREALERGGILRSSEVNWANCRKDAFPPGGWLAIVIRKLLIKLVVFCVTTANAR